MCSKSKVYAGMSLLKQGILRITFSYLSCDQGSIIVGLKLTRIAAPAAIPECVPFAGTGQPVWKSNASFLRDDAAKS